MNSFYIQETSYMKCKSNIASWGVSIKINNENEEDILHFIFHINISHIKSSRIPVMKTMSQETSYMKWRSNIASWGVSIKINNENEEDILHFIFHTNISHIKSSRIPVMKTMST